MTTTIMKQDSKIHFDDEWKQIITFAKDLGLSKDEILEFSHKKSTNELRKKMEKYHSYKFLKWDVTFSGVNMFF